jgi:pimeloyl-ACP methyl ester carboxylesterase
MKEAKIATAVYYSHHKVAVDAFHLAGLVGQNLNVAPAKVEQFRQKTGLADLYWRTYYAKYPDRNKTLIHALAEADGYVFFLHGWDGTHRIWEDLPARLAAEQPGVVCFNPDINGFGLSRFAQKTPTAEQCSPSALMNTVEQWLDLLKLHPTSRRSQPPFYLFVGHSMGGAALFYPNEAVWHNKIYGMYALAPALFCNDIQRQAFFRAVGLGIRIPSFSAIKNTLAPPMIEILAGGASLAVKNEHLRVFTRTPFGALAQTLYVLGANTTWPQWANWSHMRVALGDKDVLVGVENMLELLKQLGLQSEQIRVMAGDHYFFSYGQGSPAAHQGNREAVLQDLLAYCRRLKTEVGGI